MTGFALSPTAELAGFRLEAFHSVGSTNVVALDRARAGDRGNLWIAALRQETGRGRRGRAWSTPEGNLAATLLVVLDGDFQHAATLGFVAGLSLADALDAVAPGSTVHIAPDGGSAGRNRFELKWPNDVLANGAKMAGILLESSMLASNRMAVAVGIGVNVVEHPRDVPYPATSLSALGAACDAQRLFLALSDAWVTHFGDWRGGQGLRGIRDRWLDRAAGLGGEVAVRIDGEVKRGIFETIDEDCRFVIREAGGERLTISAGDVHFGAVASAGAAQI
ncbi:MAG: biotin--[acetyl-CoA-carboxylase] ligase [Rhizobiaceae bacterium]|nr:biotin--[acetyl-CoA-carboxylase] ligase [Rhizobiaceae bacterium]